MCITTDGHQGDTLFQSPCRNRAGQEWKAKIWTDSLYPGRSMVTFLNPWSGLVMDIYQNGTSPGTPVDGWLPNGGLNQSFVLPR
jgi:hypothetical protein